MKGGLQMYFPSKKDLWLTVIIWTIILVCIIPPILHIDPIGVFMLPTILDKEPIKSILMVGCGLFLSWLCFGTGYKIQDSKIRIKSGPYRKTINIKEIRKIRQTKNPFTAPALSMDRIEIYFGQFEMVTLSPKNKKEFIHLLLKENPHIQLDPSQIIV